MGNTEIIIILILAMFLLVAIGYSVTFAMALIGILGLLILIGPHAIRSIGAVLYNAAAVSSLVALPLFIFMGELLARGGVSTQLYQGITPWAGRFPGGLLHANIWACAVFAAISGSSPATAATIGTIAIPELEKRGYDTKLMLGSIAGGGTLGILIPPSITMIIYCTMVGESVGQLFIAGVLPGVLLATLFSVYVFVRVLFNRQLAPEVVKASRKERLLGIARMGPSGLLILMVLGTIYMGIATSTEAAAVGSLGAFIIGLFYGTINWRTFKQAIINTTQTCCSVSAILIGASFMGMLLAYAGVPLRMSSFITNLKVAPLFIMIAIYLLYLILGCFFDPMSMMVLTLPIIMPTVKVLGYDPIWFGVVLVVLCEAGMVTPPVGLNLFVMRSIAPKYSFEQVVKGVMPFFLCQLALIILLTGFPTIATWLPSHMTK